VFAGADQHLEGSDELTSGSGYELGDTRVLSDEGRDRVEGTGEAHLIGP
jgi:hypothetical protein